MINGISPTDITNITFYDVCNPLVTFFLSRTRSILIIPETIRDALFPYWVKRDSRRVACAGASRARYRPVREMCLVAPPARYIEVIVIIFFDFSHGKCNGRKTNSVCDASDGDVARNCVSPSVKLTRLLPVDRLVFSCWIESRGNRGRDTETFTRTHRFSCPLTFLVRCPSSFKRDSIGTNIEYPWKYV